MKSLILFSILLLPGTVSGADAQEIFTLEQAIEAALEHNYNVQISTIEREKAENMVTRGNSGQLPSIFLNSDLSGSYSDLELTPGSFFQNILNPDGSQNQMPRPVSYDGITSTQFSAGVGTQFIIYDGMKGRLRYQVLETGSELAALQQKSEMENTILDISRKYVQAVTLQKAIMLKEMALEQSRNRYQIVETRRAYDQASEQQLLQSLADLKADSTEYRDLILQFENAYRELHTTIGWERREVIPLDNEIQSEDMPRYEDLLHSLYENNTALNVMERRIDQAQIERKLTRSDFLPTITAGAQYGYQYLSATDGQFKTQEQLGLMGGISLKIPIFSGGRNRTATQNAQATLRQEELRYLDSEKQLHTQFDNLWQEYLHLENKLKTEKENLAVFERNHERAEDSFQQGLITGVELRAAQLSLQNAKFRVSETKYQIVLTGLNLKYLSGLLLQVELR
jgi:outer membrane protein